MAEQGQGGYDISPNVSPSSSGGAADTGAVGIDVRGGGNYGGTSLGPGSLLLTDQKGSIGASGVGGGISWILVAVVGVAALVGLWIFRRVS